MINQPTRFFKTGKFAEKYYSHSCNQPPEQNSGSDRGVHWTRAFLVHERGGAMRQRGYHREAPGLDAGGVGGEPLGLVAPTAVLLGGTPPAH